MKNIYIYIYRKWEYHTHAVKWINVKRFWEQRPGNAFLTGCKSSKFQLARALSRLLSNKYFTPMFRSLVAQYIGKPLCSASPSLFLSHVSVLHSRFTHHCILSMHTLVALNPRWIACVKFTASFMNISLQRSRWLRASGIIIERERMITRKVSEFDEFLIFNQRNTE